jgi:hypothetical protein
VDQVHGTMDHVHGSGPRERVDRAAAHRWEAGSRAVFSSGTRENREDRAESSTRADSWPEDDRSTIPVDHGGGAMFVPIRAKPQTPQDLHPKHHKIPEKTGMTSIWLKTHQRMGSMSTHPEKRDRRWGKHEIQREELHKPGKDSLN